jgi:hypothetical protein
MHRPCQEGWSGHFLVTLRRPRAVDRGVFQARQCRFSDAFSTVFQAQIYRFSGAEVLCQTFVKQKFLRVFEALNFLT